MKPKNNDDVRRAYRVFATYLALSVLFAIVAFWCYIKTSAVEIAKIQSQSAEYSKIYTQTVNLVYSVDSTYSQFLTKVNDPRYNNVNLATVISRRKVGTQKAMAYMNQEDCAVYQRMHQDLAIVMSVKDSISLLKQQEEMARKELLQSQSDESKANIAAIRNQRR